MDIFSQVFANIMSIWILLYISFGVFIGIIVGALPGLGATMTIAIVLPFTFYMPSITAIAFLIGIYCGGTYGGSISAILINIPGTASAAATLIDGRPMALKGQSGKALYAALLSSVFGGLFSGVVLIVGATLLARVALKFGPAEYFGLIIFALTIISGFSQKNIFKGLSAASIGMMLSLVGTDAIQGNLRFTFNIPHLFGGLPFVPFLIGIFGLSEILIQSEVRSEVKNNKSNYSANESFLPSPKDHSDTVFTLVELMKYKLLTFKSAIIGTAIGILPGIGASVAPFVSYSEAKRSCKQSENFGKGDVRGVIAAETANNAVTGGALIPLLTLGIPGDTTTAILFGALLIQGLVPGPLLFTQQKPLVYSLFVLFILTQLIVAALGYFILRYGTKYIIEAPKPMVFAIVVILTVIGSYASQNSLFDVSILIFCGILGYLLKKHGFPLPPVVIAFMLGDKFEVSLRQALLLYDNNVKLFLTNPIFTLFIVLSVISLFFFWNQGRSIN